MSDIINLFVRNPELILYFGGTCLLILLGSVWLDSQEGSDD